DQPGVARRGHRAQCGGEDGPGHETRRGTQETEQPAQGRGHARSPGMRSGPSACQGLPGSAGIQRVRSEMKLERHESGTESRTEACNPVLHDGPRRNVLWLMAEYFRTLGYSDVKARLPGHMAPEMLNGTLEDHRPDLTCRQHDKARTPVFLEVVLGEE